MSRGRAARGLRAETRDDWQGVPTAMVLALLAALPIGAGAALASETGFEATSPAATAEKTAERFVQPLPLLIAQAGERFTFDIPPQPLADALDAFIGTTGWQVGYSAELASGRRSAGINGSLTATEALAQLLAGTDLDYRLTSADTVTLERAVAEPESGPLRLNPLIVTGERAERTVFETPSSVVVVTGEEIEETPAFNDVENVLDFVPNIVTGGISNDGPTIRGLDSTGVLSNANAFFGGTRPRATITVDGRPLSFNEFIYGEASVWDLERVEVFRGPQSSAQGVNSIAGATYVVTADPTFEPEVKVQGEIGSEKRRRLSAAFSGPIVADELAGRVAVDFQRRDSFVDFLLTPEDGPDPNEFESIVTRGKLLWEPDSLPQLSTKLTFSFTRSESPQAEQVMEPFNELESNISASWRTTTYGGIHDLSYAFSDNLQISNRFSATDYKVERFVFPVTFGAAEIDGLQFTNETTMNWRMPALSLNGLSGVYYENTAQDEKSNFNSFLGFGDFEDTRNSLGIFGEATYQVTDRIDVTAGLRYQWDRQDRDGTLGAFTVDYDGTFDALLPKFVVGYDVTDDLRIGVLAVRGFNPGGTTIFISDGAQDTFDAETVWNFEAFGRAQLFDDRLFVEANAFYAVYDDYQTRAIRGFTPSGVPEFEIGNADRAISYGLELSADFQATDDLRIFGGLGLLDTEITDFPDSADPGIEGNQFGRAPHATVSGGVNYEVIDNLTLGSRLRYVSSYFSDDENTRDEKAGDYFVADFQISYAYEAVEAYAFVNNAFDEFYVISDFGDSAIVGPPREYGVGLRVSF